MNFILVDVGTESSVLFCPHLSVVKTVPILVRFRVNPLVTGGVVLNLSCVVLKRVFFTAAVQCLRIHSLMGILVVLVY